MLNSMSISGETPMAIKMTPPEPSFTTSFTDTTNYGAQIGQNLGTVVNNFNGQYEPPPAPSLFVPFPRDPQFISRGVLLDQIHERCLSQTNWTALVGLGGVGKSQLAIEYSYRVWEHSPETWIFWVHASNTARFEQSFQDIAEIVQIPERKSPQANVLQLVQSWLRDRRNGRWILILDNLDDADFLTANRSLHQINQAGGDSGRSQALVRYIPHTLHGSVLVTTRTRRVATELVDKDNIISVRSMSEKEGVALLKNKLGGSDVHTESQLVALATALDFMPLAMVQAAAYISNLRYSIQQYLDKFQKNDRKKEELLSYNEDLGYMRRDLEAQNTVAVTWQISFDHICQIRPSAADLLSLMSFFDRQGIPVVLLQCRPATDTCEENKANMSEDEHDDSASEPDTSVEFRRDVQTLESYSFVSVNEDATSFEMHSLVQFATRKWLQDHGQAEIWRRRSITNLYETVPTGDIANWNQCQELFPHVKSAMSQKPKENNSLLELATILYSMACYSVLKRNVADAQQMSTKATKIREKLLGPDHEDTLFTMDLMGHAFWLGGDLDKAEEIHSSLMNIRTQKLGANHPYTLVSISNLASTYWSQGRWEAAEELEVQVVKVRKEQLGADHPDTLTIMANLGSTYRSQGRLKAAEELEAQVLKLRKETLGADHPDTLTIMANLASTYRDQGQWEAAEGLEVQAVKLRKEKLGVDHPSTLTSMINLASCYQNQGRWEAAEELEVQVVKLRKEKLGANHPSTLLAMSNLAFTWKGSGKRTQAIKMMETCVGLMLQVLGVDHSETRASSAALANWKAETATDEQ